jgi:RND family efflux transporter MFP subunit
MKTSFYTLFLVLTGSLTFIPQVNANSEDKVELNKIVGVTTESVEALAFLPSRNAAARVEALNHSRIPSQISAVLESMEVKVGDKFDTGALLAKLDCKDRQFDLANQNAQATRLQQNLEFEQRQFTRGKRLAKQKTIGEAELDRLQTNVVIAEAQLKSQISLLNSAKLGVQRCQIRAPFAGVVVKRSANVGEMLAAGSAVVEIIELDRSEVSAIVSLTDSAAYLASNKFELQSNGQVFQLNNRKLLPVVNQTSRSREARLEFKNETALPGSVGRLYWYSPFYHLPANLLLIRNDKVGVFVVDGEHALFVETPNAQEGRPILLNNFEQWRNKNLIIDGRHGLVDGQRIKPKSSEAKVVNKAQSNHQLDKAQ